MAQILANYPEDVRFVYRHFPLTGTPEQPFHDKAALSTQAAEAAGLQGKFWEMHDLLFERQNEWAALTVAQFQDWLIARAAELGLDKASFSADLTSEALVKIAQDAWDFAVGVGMQGTPTIFINDMFLPLDYVSVDGLAYVIDSLKTQARVDKELADKQFTFCPPLVIDTAKQYVATLRTEKGDITLRLFPDIAPNAVNSFVFLATNQWFDGVTFHRVLPGFMAQTGDPTGTGFGNAGYMFALETSPDLKFDRAGLLAMANSGGSESNGSQFFITYGPAAHLDGQFTIFGEVISGLDVLEKITPRDPDADPNLPPGDVILSITIEEK